MQPEINCFVADPKTGNPFACLFVQGYAYEAGPIRFGGAPLVLLVLRASNAAKVCQAVVQRIAVYVVNLVNGPLTIRVQPSKSMGVVATPVDTDGDAAAFHLAASSRSGSGPAATATPCEDASIGAVVQKLAESIRGKIVFSHEAPPLLIGQRPGSVTSACWASSF